MNFRNIAIFITAMALAAASGFALQNYLASSNDKPGERFDAGTVIETNESQLRPEFAMKDLAGQLRNISEWDGKVIFINFWATWCPPCLKEIPDFIDLQTKYKDQGFVILGIAIDNDEAVRAFAAEMGMNYPVMVGEMDGIELSKRYGNRVGALPFTVVINQRGEISDRIMGELSKIDAENILQSLGLTI